MSLKPIKHSDRKKIEEKMKNKSREIESFMMLPPYTLIICEGVKTEPNYIHNLVDKINSRFSDKVKHNRFDFFGTGRNTRGLLKFARKYSEKKENEHYSRIWLMYDKDDFPNDNFDNTQFSIESSKYNDEEKVFLAAWSNESIELWFVLHFQELTANVSRVDYIKILRNYMPYKKEYKNIYDLIIEHGGDEALAIKRAEKLLIDNNDTSPSKIAPATKVHLLVQELRIYLE